MLDKNNIYLFPETIQTNPYLFFGKAVQATQEPFVINGYKLYCLIDKLETPEFPYTLVPVQKNGSSVNFYQYHFPSGTPDFKKLGFDSAITSNGTVLYMTQENFVKITTQSRYVTVKEGNWQLVSKEFYELVAFYHLDIIPQLSLNLFKSLQDIDKLSQLYHKKYDIDSAHVVSLASLYNELNSLLLFFGYTNKNVIFSDHYFLFSSLRLQFRQFVNDCFSTIYMSDCAITPSAVKQIRALFRFVRLALGKLGYEDSQSENIYHSVTATVNKFQRDYGIQESPCDANTIRMILTQLLLKGTDPVNILASCGVNIAIENSLDQKFGPIDLRNLDDVAKRFATGISRAVAPLPAPSSAVAEVEKELLSVAKSGADGLDPVNRSAEILGARLSGIKRYAADVSSETKTCIQRADEAEQGLENLQKINDDIEKTMQDMEERLKQQNSSGNWLVIGFICLIFIFIIQQLKRTEGARSIQPKQ